MNPAQQSTHYQLMGYCIPSICFYHLLKPHDYTKCIVRVGFTGKLSLMSP